MTDPGTDPWRTVLDLAELPAGSRRTVRLPGTPPRAVLVIHHEDGSIHAIDLRCPHEGYPLSDGKVDADCVLTCAWHNWKFDLRTGHTVLGGGEAVRRWPSRLVGRQVQIDTTEPDPVAQRNEVGRSLLQGLQDGRLGRCVRDTGRLLMLAVTPAEVLLIVARDDARRAEWGSTHVLPLAADCADLADRAGDLGARLHAITPALDLAIQSNARLVARPPPRGVEALIGAAPEDLTAALVAAVEAEDAEQAESIVRAAVRSGVEPPQVEAMIARVLAQHFTDFGHPVIYLQKLRELRARMGASMTSAALEDLYSGLVLSHTWGTREDTLPYLRKYFAGPLQSAPGDLVEACLDGSRAEALGALQYHWEREGRRVEAIGDELVVAAALRLWRFDEGLELRPEVEESWLTVTHRLTVALAVRQLVPDLDDADALPLLRQVVAFVHSAKAVDRDHHPRPTPSGKSLSQKAMLAAIRGCAANTPRIVAQWLGQGSDPGVPVRAGLVKILADRYTWPMNRAHAIKTFLAGEAAFALLDGHPEQAVPLLAAFRFLVAPMQERSLHGVVAGALRFLEEGKPPRRLTR